jgi:hypothetical protein
VGVICCPIPMAIGCVAFTPSYEQRSGDPI